jgi:hypothetical protein
LQRTKPRIFFLRSSEAIFFWVFIRSGPLQLHIGFEINPILCASVGRNTSRGTDASTCKYHSFFTFAHHGSTFLGLFLDV